MMTPNLRHLARESLKRAKAELACGDADRLRYAALELRFAMEALTYDRALAFKEEIPPAEYKTWQPRKLMLVLHDIDPTIGMSSTLAIGLEDEPGKAAPPEKMQHLGTDVVLTLADLKGHYDAIGSSLHMPSLDQIEKGKPFDPVKFRDRCEKVVGVLEGVLSSPVWNTTMGNFAELECMRCATTIRRRIPSGKTEIEVHCFQCGAGYAVKDAGPGKTLWEPQQQEIECPTPGCEAKVVIWRDEIQAGTCWQCPKCGQCFLIALTVVRDNKPSG